LPVSSGSPPFVPLAEAWKEQGWEGRLICESPLIEKDALVLQKEYAKA
jgi:endonuclease IV